MAKALKRMIKTKREIKLLEKSAKISNSCLPIIKQALKEDRITEKEIARKIRKKLKEQNARLAFRIIVASGKRSAKIHPKPKTTNRIIKGMGFVDFGACYKRYRTDVTVPFIKGKIGKKERKIIKTVLQAYKIAINSVEIGKPCWKLHEKIDNFLKRHDFNMSHSLGHGIGLKIHELPTIGIPKKLTRKRKLRWKKLKKIKFQENMVFTIEPAIYVRGVGGCRIENDFLLKKKKLKILTNSNLIKL
jgi:Xaa-Pro aminopeptidase